jgi:DNA end-binding protein Ku
MARPLWKGAISFGMVSIPVRLYTATEEKDIHFNMLHDEDMSRIRQKRFCAEEDIEVDLKDIVKGYEVSPGQYVILEDDDFEKVPVNTTRTIEITEFVNLEKIDPILYQKTYYLEPEEVGMKPFALLMRALEDSGRVAIAKVTLRQKEQLCSLRLYEDTIALETMFYSDEVRSTDELSVPGEKVQVSDRELTMAKSLVDMLSSDDFDFEQYKDNYREALLDIIKLKAEGQTIEAPKAAPAKITDLTEALRASVEAIRKQKGGDHEAEPQKEERPRARARAS